MLLSCLNCSFFFLLCVQQVPTDAVQEVSVVEVFNEVLRHTRTWFRNALNKKLLKENLEPVMFSSHLELWVCQLLII